MIKFYFRNALRTAICLSLFASSFTVHADATSNQYELFIQGLVGHLHMGPYGGGTFKPEITYKNLPPKLENIVALPEKSAIIGSLISGSTIDMVFVSNLSPEDIKKNMEDKMMTLGWSNPPQPMRPKPMGFQPHSKSNILDSLFCYKDTSTFIRLFIHPNAENKNVVLLKYIEGRERSPCNQARPMRMPLHTAPIPNLINPKNINARIGHSSGNGNAWSTSVTLESADVSMLTEHYSEQLNNSSWTPIEGMDGQNLSWRIWRFKDDDNTPWTGMMLVSRNASDDKTSKARLWVFSNE